MGAEGKQTRQKRHKWECSTGRHSKSYHITTHHINTTKHTTQNNTKSQHRQNITEQRVTKVKEKSADNAQDNDNKKQQVKA